MRRTIYNLFASMCSFVLKTEPRDYLVRFSCVSEGEKRRIERKIRQNVPSMFGADGPVLPCTAAGPTTEFMNSVSAFAVRLRQEKDCNCIMELLKVLDQVLHPVLEEELEQMSGATELRALNSNKESTGIELYTRCQCVWARKSRQYFSERRIDNYLQYMVVIEKERIVGITAHHIFIPQGFFPHFDAEGELKIAASPVAAETDFKIVFHQNQEFQSFTLDYTDSDGDFFTELVWSKICEAGHAGAEVAVFPEMLGTPDMEERIEEKLRRLTPGERETIPPMIILPTVFVDRQNYATILDREGNFIARQFKHNPYIMDGPDGTYMEDISGSSEVIVFHYPGIGRFAVMICKDFLTTRYMEKIMRGFKLTMIIIPAYSTGAYDFRTSFETCAHDYCNVVWINSCAAMAPGKEKNFRYIGYVRKRITRDQKPEDAYNEMRPCPGLLQGTCGHDCLYIESLGKVPQEAAAESGQ